MVLNTKQEAVHKELRFYQPRRRHSDKPSGIHRDLGYKWWIGVPRAKEPTDLNEAMSTMGYTDIHNTGSFAGVFFLTMPKPFCIIYIYMYNLYNQRKFRSLYFRVTDLWKSAQWKSPAMNVTATNATAMNVTAMKVAVMTVTAMTVKPQAANCRIACFLRK